MAEFWVDPNAAGGANSGTGTEGDPYGSLNRFFNQQLANFNSATEDYIVNCLAGADAADMDGDWTIDTTSATVRQLIIRAQGANRHTGVRNTGYRYTGTSSRFGIRNDNANVTVRLEGIVSSGGQRIQANGSGPVILDAVAVFDALGSWGLYYFGTGTLIGYNCLSVGNSGYGFQIEDGTAAFYNSVFAANGLEGSNRLAGTLTLVNCYSGGNTGQDYGGVTTFINCYSEDGAQSNPTALYSTATFTDVTAGAENLRLVPGSTLINAGVGPSVNPNVPVVDFEGDPRSGATTDVGFDQLAVASTTPVITGISDTSLTHGQTGIVITGTNFSASGNTVLISPTNDVEDVDAVAQTITAESATEITFTADLDSFDFGTLYLFVVNADSESNTDGEEITYISGDLNVSVDPAGQLTLTGQEIPFQLIVVESGIATLQFTGSDITLSYRENNSYTLEVVNGSLTLTGSNMTFKVNGPVSEGQLKFTGSNISLVATGVTTLPPWVTSSLYGSWIFKVTKAYVVSASGRTRWVHYIPVKKIAIPDVQSNSFANSGAIAVEVLSSTTGLVEWVDYIPIVEVNDDDAGRWRTDNNGFIPIVEIL